MSEIRIKNLKMMRYNIGPLRFASRLILSTPDFRSTHHRTSPEQSVRVSKSMLDCIVKDGVHTRASIMHFSVKPDKRHLSFSPKSPFSLTLFNPLPFFHPLHPPSCQAHSFPWDTLASIKAIREEDEVETEN